MDEARHVEARSVCPRRTAASRKEPGLYRFLLVRGRAGRLAVDGAMEWVITSCMTGAAL
ncbi:hypothetical protein MPC1_5580003 [Methylocella tundrae]|nr:hypothetical protein MPC1_5580003 [Methylocella tundrae]